MAITFIQSLIATLLYVGVSTIVLWFVTTLFKLKNQEFVTAFYVAGVTTGVNFVLSLIPPLLKFSSEIAPTINTLFLLVSFAVGIFLIMKYYEQKFWKSLGILAITVLFIQFVGFVSGQLLQIFSSLF